MEKRKIPVVKSEVYYYDVQNIFDYGVEVFGYHAADAFVEDLISKVESLAFQYELYPECRHITTKNRIYRNIILASYLIIYRITPNKIEVLRAISGRMSVSKIKAVRSIKL